MGGLRRAFWRLINAIHPDREEANFEREVAPTAAGLLLLSRRMASREMIGLVDWHLLVLFIGLFVVNHAVDRAGVLEALYLGLASAGVDLARPE